MSKGLLKIFMGNLCFFHPKPRSRQEISLSASCLPLFSFFLLLFFFGLFFWRPYLIPSYTKTSVSCPWMNIKTQAPRLDIGKYTTTDVATVVYSSFQWSFFIFASFVEILPAFHHSSFVFFTNFNCHKWQPSNI